MYIGSKIITEESSPGKIYECGRMQEHKLQELVLHAKKTFIFSKIHQLIN